MKEATNPRIAAILSFLFNGIGQIYNGEIKKGLWIVFLSGISILIFLIGGVLIIHWLIIKFLPLKELVWGIILTVLGFIFITILGIYSIFDAYNVAKRSCKD